MYPNKIINKKAIILLVLNSFILNIFYYLPSVALNNFFKDDITNSTLIILIALIIGSYLMVALCNHIWFVFGSDYLAKFERDLQLSYFKRVMNMPVHKLNNVHSGYLKKQIDIICSAYEGYLRHIMFTGTGFIISVMLFLFNVFKQSFLIFLICIVFIMIAIFINKIIAKRYVKITKKRNEEFSKYSSAYVDFLQNSKTIKYLKSSDFASDVVTEKHAIAFKHITKSNRIGSLRFNLVSVLMTLMFLIILINLYFQFKTGLNVVPVLVFYISIFSNMSGEIRSLSYIFLDYDRLVSANSNIESVIDDSKEREEVRNVEYISIKDLNFKYTETSDTIVIDNFLMFKGDKVSIVGESGQGKTTFLNILTKNLLIDEDKYLINGISTNKILDIAYVSQETELLDLSIYDNLTLGKEIDHNYLNKLIKETGLNNWINSLENGLYTTVGEKGIKLSTGQKQRINLLRSILLDSEFYILDEPTSNLDIESEELIIKLIDKYLKNKTCVIVTHRSGLKKICNKHYEFNNHVMSEVK